MRKLLSVLKVLVLAFTAVVGLALGAALLFFPRVSPAEEVADRLPRGDVERGRYLVENVANCLDCHSERNWDFYGGPVVPGTEGKGAPLRVLRPETWSANITPAALGEWSDGEIARAITAGVGRDGRALHPFMPYDSYARLAPADVAAIVAYLRVMPAIEHTPPKPEEGFAFRLLARLLPKPYEAPEPVDPTDRVAYGRYLAGVAECSFCHRADYSGGRSFRIPGTEERGTEERVLSENLTPHPSNRIGAWSQENFIGVFRSFAPPEGSRIPGDRINTVMPWSRYAGMTDEDLAAIYEYLRTLEPVKQEPAAPTDSAESG